MSGFFRDACNLSKTYLAAPLAKRALAAAALLAANERAFLRDSMHSSQMRVVP
jgi:hypothetical protein